MPGINECAQVKIEKIPVEYFLESISKSTGWDKQDFLKSKDIGNLESKLNIKAKKPIQTNSTKRGKSMNPLYRFVSDGEREMIKASVDKLLE